MSLRLVMVGLGLFVVALGFAASCVIWRAAELGELVGPIQPRGFHRLSLVTVGTGGSYENPERLGPSTAVGWGDQILLVDAGRGVAEALRKARIPVDQPSRILLTNLLPVNTEGLDDLLYTAWLEGRREPITLIGPTGTRALADGILAGHAAGADALGRALALPPQGAELDVIEVDDGFTGDWEGLTAIAGALPGGPLPALAWRFEAHGNAAVVSGTGWGEDALVEFAHGADVLVHEGVVIPKAADLEDSGVVADPERLEREAALHTSLQEVGRLAERARVGTLVLVRLRPPPFFTLQVTATVGKEFHGEIRVPDDGDEIRL